MRSKIVNIILFLIIILLLILLFSQQEQLRKYISKEISLQADTNLQKTLSHHIDSLYNYTSDYQEFELTFLEFGAEGCVACRKMEFVLNEAREEYPDKVNVVFLNILQIQNQGLMNHFGIVAIPTQVLLDKSGIEYFRHTGYISFSDLKKHFNLPSE